MSTTDGPRRARMERRGIFAALVMTALLAVCMPAATEPAESDTLDVVVVTGGHGFDDKAFLGMFDAIDGIAYTHVHLRDHSEIFEDISDWPYDVIVLYNMSQEISEKRQANFEKLLERGVGLRGLHHAIANYPEWPKYAEIIGAHYFRKPTRLNGVEHERSDYTHDLEFNVHVEDPDHPITQGMSDFEVYDEVYRKWILRPDVHVLLTTDHPESHKALAWVREEGEARVCFIQVGHGPQVFGQQEYRGVVGRAIRWAAQETKQKKSD